MVLLHTYSKDNNCTRLPQRQEFNHRRIARAAPNKVHVVE